MWIARRCATAACRAGDAAVRLRIRELAAAAASLRLPSTAFVADARGRGNEPEAVPTALPRGRLQVRKRGGRKRALGHARPDQRCRRGPTSAGRWISCPTASPTAGASACWRSSTTARARCLALVADTSLSGARVARELDAMSSAGAAEEMRFRQRHGAHQHGDPEVEPGEPASTGTTSSPASRSRTRSPRASSAGCATSA